MQRFGPVHRHCMENLVRIVSTLEVRSILDVGCGSGENLSGLAAADRYELTGIDVSGKALELARQRVPDARFLQMDVQHEALSEKFDLVTSLQVVEHLPDDVSAIQNMARMARKYVLISTVQGRMRPSEIKIGHVRNYSDTELHRKLEMAGLEVVDVSRWGFPFYSPLYRSLVEWLPGGPPDGPLGPTAKLASRLLYNIYRLNLPGRGDIIFALSRKP